MNDSTKIQVVQLEVNKLENEYSCDFQDIANKVFEKYVVPVCIARNWTFAGGMGSFVFYDEDEQVNLKHECNWLFEILTTEDITGLALGSFMDYYPER